MTRTAKNCGNAVDTSSRGSSSLAMSVAILGLGCLVITAVAALLSYSTSNRFSDTLRTVNDQRDTADAILSYAALLRETEHAENAYLLDGSDSSSADFSAKMSRVSADLESLRSRANGDADLSSRLDEIEPRVSVEMARMTHAIEQRKNFGVAGVGSNAASASKIGNICALLASADRRFSDKSKLNAESASARARRLETIALTMEAFTLTGFAFCILFVWRDRSALQSLARAIAVERDTWRSAIHHSPVATVIAGSDRRVMACNLAFERISQYSSEDIVGRDLSKLMIPRGLSLETAQHIEHAFSGTSCSLSTRRMRRDRSTVAVQLLSTPLILEDGRVGIVQAILEQPEDRSHLAKALKCAQEQNQSLLTDRQRLIDDVIASLSTPLRSLLAGSWRLREAQQSDGHSIAQKMSAALESLRTAVGRIADFQRLEHGRLKLKTREFDLHEVLQGTSIPVTIQEDVPKRVVGDPERLTQIIEMLATGLDRGCPIFFCADVESRSANQACLYFAIRGSFIDVRARESAFGKRLAERLAILMGGRLWGNAGTGFQFHIVVSLPAENALLGMTPARTNSFRALSPSTSTPQLGHRIQLRREAARA